LIATLVGCSVVGLVAYLLTRGESQPDQGAVKATSTSARSTGEVPTQPPSLSPTSTEKPSASGTLASSATLPQTKPPSLTLTPTQPSTASQALTGFAAAKQPVFEQCALQGDGVKPQWNQGTLISTISPTRAPAAPISRSEAFWRPAGSTRPLKLQEGDRIFFRFTVTPHLGTAAQSTSDTNSTWSLISQMHGPLGTPEKPIWSNPEGELAVQGGWWIYSAGVYDRNNNWYERLAPYRDGQTLRFGFDIKLSSGTDGWVKVWVDGVKKVDVNKPVLQKDNWDGVELRTGVYSGDWANRPLPTQKRWAQYTDIRLNYVPGPHAVRLPEQPPSGTCYGVTPAP
jgi:hypothetical protein